MLDIYIILITASVFSFCTAVLVHQAIYSLHFRKNIAIPHDFSEGIMTGLYYPILWVIYGLMTVQFISFIAFKNSSELFLTLRLICFALTVLAFCLFKALTPPLLALWFGKSAFWDTKGENGKHLYSDVYCAKVYSEKHRQVLSNQQICKISFYVKGKTFLFLPKKYSCKMTARQIASLSPQISFKDRTTTPNVEPKALVYAICMPILVFFITLCCFFQAVSTGILNNEKYEYSDTPYTSEIATLTEISDAVTDGEKIFVFYDKVGAVNVYTLTGTQLYSISLPHSVFKHTEITVSNGNLFYHFGSEVYTYSGDGKYISKELYKDEHKDIFSADCKTTDYGNINVTKNNVSFISDEATITVCKRDTVTSLFSTSFIWPINMLFICALFVLRYYVVTPQNDSHRQISAHVK